MARWCARLGQYALVLWAALSLNFVLPHLAPGDPIDVFAGEANSLTPEARARLETTFDVEGSVVDQYRRHWARLADGDLGISVRTGRPVAGVLLERLPWTLLLVGTGTVVSAVVGIVGGALAARLRGRRRDLGLVGVVLVLDAMPGFWIGMVVVSVFAVQLGWLPSFGAVPLDASTLTEWVVAVGRRLVLPVATIVLATAGTTFLLVRGAMVSALESPSVLLAEATGLSPRRILYGRALRNALLPAFTNLALTVGTLLSGVVVIETVFSYPGLGRLVFEAVTSRDYALLQGAFLLVTLTVVAVNLLADLAYPRLDPRVRGAGTAANG